MSSQEAAKRLVQYGYNEISEKKTSPILKFLSYFWGPIPWMIEIAAVLSAIIQHWEDFWIIFVLLLLNASVGFWQEILFKDLLSNIFTFSFQQPNYELQSSLYSR
ncbi:MAG: cation-transporting P-type ATPase [Candidatus Methanoperedens sp.]|nr:cation-transporting P-type ATPase [Candidatus Methanoperedens sp.]